MISAGYRPASVKVCGMLEQVTQHLAERGAR